MLFLLKEIYKRDLNTYHVKVQFVKNVGAYITKTNLNTYHVKVQFVNRQMLANRERFKYISC